MCQHKTKTPYCGWQRKTRVPVLDKSEYQYQTTDVLSAESFLIEITKRLWTLEAIVGSFERGRRLEKTCHPIQASQPPMHTVLERGSVPPAEIIDYRASRVHQRALHLSCPDGVAKST